MVQTKNANLCAGGPAGHRLVRVCLFQDLDHLKDACLFSFPSKAIQNGYLDPQTTHKGNSPPTCTGSLVGSRSLKKGDVFLLASPLQEITQKGVPRVSMTLKKWGHYPKYRGHGPIFKGSEGDSRYPQHVNPSQDPAAACAASASPADAELEESAWHVATALPPLPDYVCKDLEARTAQWDAGVP